MKNSLRCLIIISSVILFINSCDKNPVVSDIIQSLTIENRTGTLQVTQGASVNTADLNVVSFAGSSDLTQDGSFTVQSNRSVNYQMLFFNSKTGTDPVYLGLYDPVTAKMMANDTSTALSLTLFNPHLIYTDQSNRSEYLNAVKQSDKFTQLLSLLNTAYQTDAKKALDYDTNPKVYQLATELMKETLIKLGGENSQVPVGDPPSIKNAPNADISFSNPSKLWYAAGVYTNGQNFKESIIIEREQTKSSLKWGWPPIVETDLKETLYPLGDGYSKLQITKGMDFTKFGQWDDPIGKATMLNTVQMLIYYLELVIGQTPTPNYEKIYEYLVIDNQRAIQLNADINNRDVEGFLTHFLHLLDQNNLDLADFFWGGTSDKAAPKYLKTTSDMFSKMNFMFEILGYNNQKGPFIGDLLYSQKDITFYVTQTNGVITSQEENNPPTAAFSISPPAGIINTVFTFDASLSTDDRDDVNSLEYRWDFNSDGNWDTQWLTDNTANHTYSEAGAFTANLEVKDSDDLIGTASHSLNVGGGAGTATHVKLFQDNLPWDSNAMVEVLENLGFVEGLGTDTYEIISSSNMSNVNLIPGEDLVIISNDQNQTFYENYYNSQLRFTNFIYMGGSMLWEACDRGWALGSIEDAGVILPGNLTIHHSYDSINYVTNQNLPLVAGLPYEMDHNSASHESFLNYPDGTTIYTINTNSEPTLIEFNLGGGWIIVSGQPLEHQYERIYGSPDMEQLLPRIISYFTGKTLGKLLHKHLIQDSIRSSN